ncbi:MAG: winged helix-turn-helix domain-containing protein [Verrucomicrobiae bacterium]|nr:winged helix-turn-helix domain-containing protein [Verrucomicrobiae bacterium]
MSLALTIQTAEPPHVQIERFLRKQIQTGQLKPSARLPATTQLIRQWHVGPEAVHKAMTRLAAEGLIERSRKRGTFVKPAVKNAVIGILIGRSLTDETAHFHRALAESLRREIAGLKDSQWTSRVYDGLYDPKNASSRQNLSTDLENYTFKGFIQILRNPVPLKSLSLSKSLSSVRLGAPSQNPPADVVMSENGFFYESIRFAAQKQLGPAVCLRLKNPDEKSADGLEGIEKARRDFNFHDITLHDIHFSPAHLLDIEQAAYDKTMALAGQWEAGNQRPGVLLVSDDMGMQGVALALARKNVDVPGQLRVIVKANQGIVHHYGMPVMRYEYSPPLIAATLLQILRQKINAESPANLPVEITGGEGFAQ